MTALDVSGDERWALGDALRRERDAVARQRRISETDLAQCEPGDSHVAVINRLAVYEELKLAALDRLMLKLAAA